MSTGTELKVLALGPQMTIQRLISAVSNRGIDIFGTEDADSAIAVLKQEKFDVVIIDSVLEETSATCRIICDLAGAPVALLVNETSANWKNLSVWDVDGFIPEESGKIELVARLKAISRRRIHHLKTPEIETI